MEKVIDYQVDGAVATVTLNRPEKRNALNVQLVDALTGALKTAADDDAVRCVVITGAGSSFSAGADLEDLRKLQYATRAENEDNSRGLAELFTQIYLHPKAVIAKVNGHAIAGGCGLAAVCDLSIAAREAKLGFPEVRIGFVPAIVSVFVVPRIGQSHARELFLRGHLIGAEEAAAIGLITRAVAAGDLDATVDDLAAEIANETSGTAIETTRRLLADLSDVPWREGLDRAVEINAAARSTSDCRAGVSAFLEKRDPPWKQR